MAHSQRTGRAAWRGWLHTVVLIAERAQPVRCESARGAAGAAPASRGLATRKHVRPAAPPPATANARSRTHTHRAVGGKPDVVARRAAHAKYPVWSWATPCGACSPTADPTPSHGRGAQPAPDRTAASFRGFVWIFSVVSMHARSA